MRVEEKSSKYPPLELGWNKPIQADDYEDLEGVRVVNSGETSDLGHQFLEAEEVAGPEFDMPEPVILQKRWTADDLHNQRVAELRTALETAHNFLTLPKTGARAWARDLAYADQVMEQIEDAGERIIAALKMIEIHEKHR